ncbi:hypothetical protein [Pediococcus pentosaceus]|uniref:hypothetical protein n=1 Tax=Pediococcus pentosaceus TaxID=1255 RepID=UPI0035932B14
MYYILATLFFVGCLLLIAGIITLIVALITKKKKKTGLYLILAGAIGFFVAPTIESSIQNTRSAEQKTHKSTKKIYKVNIDKVKVDDTDWDVTGTTNAPDGAKVICISNDKSSQIITKTDISDASPVVKDGKFKGTISGIFATDDKAKAGEKVKLFVVATKQKVWDDDDFIKSEAAGKILNPDFKIKLTFTKNQKDSIDDVDSDDDNESDDSSNSVSSSSESSSSKNKESINAYKESMNKYIENKGWSEKLDFSYDPDDNQAKFEIGDSTIMAESKEAKRNLYVEFKEHSDEIADMCDLKEQPKLQIITSDGQVVAETKVLSDGVTIH